MIYVELGEEIGDANRCATLSMSLAFMGRSRGLAEVFIVHCSVIFPLLDTLVFVLDVFSLL